uniref:NADH dehydrogenase subunit 6 n=1 Tax=Parachtes teruelis TaxID=1110494 RepID=A0A516IMM3_9ARAC|nr:NADH dehydrogenase subunit 6 [Parachtes teruelis]
MMLFLLGLIFLLLDHAMGGIICIMGIVVWYFYQNYVISSSVWFGLVMILVLISGVLILFTYMVSLTPNDSFEISSVWASLLLLLTMMVCKEKYLFYGFDISFLSLSLWEMDFMVYLLFGLGFLLLVMLFIIEVVMMSMGPLRVE